MTASTSRDFAGQDASSRTHRRAQPLDRQHKQHNRKDVGEIEILLNGRDRLIS